MSVGTDQGGITTLVINLSQAIFIVLLSILLISFFLSYVSILLLCLFLQILNFYWMLTKCSIIGGPVAPPGVTDHGIRVLLTKGLRDQD